QLTLEAGHAPAAEQAKYHEAIATYARLAEDQKKKKEQLKQKAEDAGKLYDALNYRDDQFDLSDTLTALAISLLAVTALTHKWWLYWISLVPTGFGALMGLAGLFGWKIHSDFLAWLLS
ncbi:MAG: DUF4337 domain-containing protein, partial [Planctomycetia bacterium]|nr:DUF4337 domain-containing protein [Planctomycetia bacterium]